MSLKNISYFFISAFGIFTTLIYGKDLIIPFILGLLFWFMMRGIKTSLELIPIVKRVFPSWITSIISIIIFVIAMAIFVEVLTSNIQALTQSYPKYQPNLDSIIDRVNQLSKFNLQEAIERQRVNFDFGNILGIIFNSISDILSNTFMILLYALFIIFEENNFKVKLKNLFPDQHQFELFDKTKNKIEKSISDYFRLKAFVSLITGVLSYLVLLIIGVDAPAFWAFLIFILNFIPTIGSLIGTIFPAVFSLLQFGEFTPFILVLVIVGIIQVIVGNIVEPRLMGKSMNISPLVTILALTFWGMIWGVIGMVLSIPIMVVLVITFSQFESTRPIAILLSEKGEIDERKV